MSQQPSQLQHFADDKDVDPKNFSSLAYTMAKDEDITILRRFDELNILNLLMLQDELHGLSESLKDLCWPKQDDPDGIPPGYLASYVHKLGTDTEPQKQEEEAKAARAQKWRLLRGRLKEYSESSPSLR